jgi:hypothetical protein
MSEIRRRYIFKIGARGEPFIEEEDYEVDSGARIPGTAREIGTNVLDRLWNQLHTALLLLSGAAGSAPDSHTRRLKPSSAAPSSIASMEVRELEHRWDGCHSDEGKWSVLRAAKAVLDSQTIPNADPRSLRGTQEWREIVAKDPRPSRTVAKIYGLSKNTVLRYRAEFHTLAA